MADRPQLPPEVQPPEQPRDPRLLNPAFLAEAGKFIRSPVWADIKRAMLVRRPPAADVEDQPHVAAAKGFKGLAWMDALDAIEALPFEAGPEILRPAISEALLDTKD